MLTWLFIVLNMDRGSACTINSKTWYEGIWAWEKPCKVQRYLYHKQGWAEQRIEKDFSWGIRHTPRIHLLYRWWRVKKTSRLWKYRGQHVENFRRGRHRKIERTPLYWRETKSLDQRLPDTQDLRCVLIGAIGRDQMKVGHHTWKDRAVQFH